MSQPESEPIFCTECQNEVKVEEARVLDGKVLCPADLAKKSLFAKMRARKLPQNYRRRSGRFFQRMVTSMAAFMLVVGGREAKEGTVAVRERQKGDVGTSKLEELIEEAKRLIETKVAANS